MVAVLLAGLLLAPGALAVGIAQPPSRLVRHAGVHEQALRPFGQAAIFAQERIGSRDESDNAINYRVENLRTMPHEDRPWTQALEFAADGRLIETTGDFPSGVGSSIRVLDPSTGHVVKRITDGLANDKGNALFLEGLSELNGRFYTSTYNDHKVLEFDEDMNLKRSLDFPQVGWGLTHTPDRTAFLGTNGTEFVIKMEPESFAEVSSTPATCMGKAVTGLNELEMVDDFLGKGPALLGNIINTRLVLVLDPQTMKCRGTLHLQSLEPEAGDEQMGYHVANGIAYNKQTKTFWVTGKNWASMFEIRISEDVSEKPEALNLLSAHLGVLF